MVVVGSRAGEVCVRHARCGQEGGDPRTEIFTQGAQREGVSTCARAWSPPDGWHALWLIWPPLACRCPACPPAHRGLFLSSRRLETTSLACSGPVHRADLPAHPRTASTSTTLTRRLLTHPGERRERELTLVLCPARRVSRLTAASAQSAQQRARGEGTEGGREEVINDNYG